MDELHGMATGRAAADLATGYSICSGREREERMGERAEPMSKVADGCGRRRWGEVELPLPGWRHGGGRKEEGETLGRRGVAL